MTMSPVSSAIRLLSACATFAALVFAAGSTRAAGPALSRPYDLSAFAAPDGPVLGILAEPQGAARYRVSHDLSLRQKRLAIECPAHSIQTFEVENVLLP